MRSFRLTSAVLLAVFALSAVMASTAMAEEAPFWSIQGTRLAAGQTHFITAKINKEGEAGAETFTLSGGGVSITCTKLIIPLETGVLLGSNAGEPGTNDETLEFKGCTQVGNGAACTVVEPIVTQPVKSELVENVEGGKPGKKLYTEFKPLKGAKFVVIKFAGTCKVKEIAVEGSVAGTVLTHEGVQVELPNKLQQATSWLITLPKTPITAVWLIAKNEKGELVGKEEKVELLTNTEPATLVGTALVLLAKSVLKEGKLTLETELVEWSPLP